MNYFDYIFVVLTFAWYIFYALTKIKLIPNIDNYFSIFIFYYQIYICLLLMCYFNPFMNVKLTKVKKQMIFTAALMLLFSIGTKNIYNKIKYHINLINS